MPLVPLKFAPGIRLDDTAQASEGGFIAGDKVRWSRGMAQPMGGFVKLTQETFTGYARGAHSWARLSGDPELAWGTNAKLYAYSGGAIYDITSPEDPPTAGRVDGVGGTGYGASSYGSGTYGTGSTESIRAQVWHLQNFGENLVALFAGGSLYEWQPAAASDTSERVAGGDFDSGGAWSAGTGWTIAADIATASAGTGSNLAQTLPTPLEPGKVYRFTADLVRSAGSLTVSIGAFTSDAYSATGEIDFIFVAPSPSTTLTIAKDSSFAGTIDNVSIKMEADSYVISQAPSRSDAMFVDPNGFVVLLGTVEADGDYNSLLIRWCSQQNLRSWVPDVDNTAREVSVAKGSRLVGGIATRGQNLVWTDSDVYSMQYTGDPDFVFSVRPMGSNCGLIGPHAAAEADGLTFWMSNVGQFYMSNGQSVQVIDCPVRTTIFANLAPGQNDKVFAYINSAFGEVWWTYADVRDGIECSRYVAYNWRENHWTTGTFARSSWVPPGYFSSPIGFGLDGCLYAHEVGMSADGGIFSAYVETAAFDIQEGENLAAVRRFVPDFKDVQGGLSMTVSVRRFPNAAWSDFGPYSIAETTEDIPLRIAGREIKLRFDWSDFEISGRFGAIRADIVPMGQKR